MIVRAVNVTQKSNVFLFLQVPCQAKPSNIYFFGPRNRRSGDI